MHSVAAECERCFPGLGARFSALWRTKQLEYTWLKSLMGRYEAFEAITRAAAKTAAANLGLELSHATLEQLMRAYDRLCLFPDAKEALASLDRHRRAILSNGSPRMLDAVVSNSGLGTLLDRVLSAHEAGIFKPHPSVYALVCTAFALQPGAVAFVSSNFWDVAGASSFGFRTFWINRTQSPPEELGCQPTAVLTSLTELASRLAG
ncbi:MAG TPA: haloacid dehalogenase type II [Burkholderiales bacterium]|nr:haloacid dehalogenase type II [Burkholderiales bacterium]